MTYALSPPTSDRASPSEQQADRPEVRLLLLDDVSEAAVDRVVSESLRPD
jgi:hypothetical protein